MSPSTEESDSVGREPGEIARVLDVGEPGHDDAVQVGNQRCEGLGGFRGPCRQRCQHLAGSDRRTHGKAGHFQPVVRNPIHQLMCRARRNSSGPTLASVITRPDGANRPPPAGRHNCSFQARKSPYDNQTCPLGDHLDGWDQRVPHTRPAGCAQRGAGRDRLAYQGKGGRGGAALGLRPFTSYEALLEDPSIDAVYNPLPNNLHAEWTIKALEAGKNVLCEKPLALSVAEVGSIADAASRTGGLVLEAFMYRHSPRWQRAVQLVREGALGDPRLVNIAFAFVVPTDPPNIRFMPEAGGGIIWDMGCYASNMARGMMGAGADRGLCDRRSTSRPTDRDHGQRGYAFRRRPDGPVHGQLRFP